MIIGAQQVRLAFDEGMHWGDQWTACWRNSEHRASPEALCIGHTQTKPGPEVHDARNTADEITE